ncbi:MAG: pyruvate kinase [Clostridia bacterium]|nr:pyruvate kinase [Clostridia bacterium]
MKKTKIICTLGPATETKEIISSLYDAGMNVVRLNFSHGAHKDHAEKIAIVKQIREERGIALPILLDTKGPEFRIRTFANKKVTLKDGQTFIFTTEEIVGDETKVGVSYKGMCEELQPGDKILLNNGLIVFEVTEINPPEVVTKVLIGGETSNNKSMFFPDKELHMEYLSEQDKKDLAFGVEQGVDFIALSFVSKAQDVLDVKEYLKSLGSTDIDVIAKIENRAGVNNLEEIIEVSEGIMVARGDLGVEIPFEELPNIQKHIISLCRSKGKRVITATEMLESMIHQPRPTRAEISDVANAVYDGTSAVMLSGETAAGEYPVQAVTAMAKICVQAENNTQYIGEIDAETVNIASLNEALSHSACTMAMDIGAKCIVVCTRTGGTARMVSRFRPMIDIVGMTTDEKAYQQLALSWGVIPAMAEEYTSVDVLFHFAKDAAKKQAGAKKGDIVVITGGNPNGKSGNSSLINVERI